MILHIVFGILVTLYPAGAATDVVTRQIQGESSLILDISVPPGEFTYSSLVQRSNTLLRERKAVQFLQVRFSGELPPIPPAPKHSHYSYDSWRPAYDQSANVPIRTAELLAIGGNAILRYRNGSQMEHTVLQGRNPLLFRAAGASFEVIELRVAKGFGVAGREIITARVYLRTSDPLTVVAGMAAHQEVHTRLQAQEVSVMIRNDAWFIDDIFFPVRHPFLPDQPPPGRAEYEQSRGLRCSDVGGKVSCP